jgi:hypothetical protein
MPEWFSPRVALLGTPTEAQVADLKAGYVNIMLHNILAKKSAVHLKQKKNILGIILNVV